MSDWPVLELYTDQYDLRDISGVIHHGRSWDECWIDSDLPDGEYLLVPKGRVVEYVWDDTYVSDADGLRKVVGVIVEADDE